VGDLKRSEDRVETAVEADEHPHPSGTHG
jgi:hypothetical protein